MIVIGIDNGLDGAVAVLGSMMPRVCVCPTVTQRTGKQAKRLYDEPAMRELLFYTLTEVQVTASLIKYVEVHAFIELAQPMRGFAPGKKKIGKGETKGGAKASFGTGLGFGIWRGLLTGLQIRYEIVHPRTWQSVMLAGMNRSDTKAASIIAAKRLFPGVNLRRTDKCKKDHEGMADALLIASYGQRLLAGGI